MIPYDKYTTKDFLHSQLTFVQATDSVTEVYQQMQKHRVRHVPVIENGEAVGIISDRDVNFVTYSSGVTQLTAKEIMVPEPYSINDGEPIRDAIFHMWQKKIGSALINDKSGKVVGIFTSSDALRILSEQIAPEDE